MFVHWNGSEPRGRSFLLQELKSAKASNSSFSLSLRMATCAFFAWEAARDAPSHCCLPSVIASFLATIFDVWCSCALVVTGSRIPRPPQREGRARRRRVSRYMALWPSMPAKTSSSAPVPREQKQISLQEWLVQNSSILLRSRGTSCVCCVGLTDYEGG